MRIIVDSGSSKARWALEGDPWRYVTTQGLNPRLASDAVFHTVIGTVCETLGDPSGCRSVTFYGAGCGTTEMQERVRQLLLSHFPEATVTVESDMLGACRALCGKQPGTVAILGTGSNVCRYDGTRIVHQGVSVGYLLGDEGSGNHIGRRLMKDYLVGRMPAELAQQLAEQYRETREAMVSRLYSDPFPNRYMATFAPFAAAHRSHPYIQELLRSVFSTFWDDVVRPVADGGCIHFAGGVAATFAAEIKQVAPTSYTVGKVVQEPLDGLIKMNSRQ